MIIFSFFYRFWRYLVWFLFTLFIVFLQWIFFFFFGKKINYLVKVFFCIWPLFISFFWFFSFLWQKKQIIIFFLLTWLSVLSFFFFIYCYLNLSVNNEIIFLLFLVLPLGLLIELFRFFYLLRFFSSSLKRTYFFLIENILFFLFFLLSLFFNFKNLLLFCPCSLSLLLISQYLFENFFPNLKFREIFFDFFSFKLSFNCLAIIDLTIVFCWLMFLLIKHYRIQKRLKG